MYSDISKSWKFVEYAAKYETGIPADAEDVDLPVDLLRYRNRNYNSAMGEYGSYYDAAVATFYKSVPAVGKSEWVVLEVEGVCQIADIYVNGNFAGHVEGAGKHYVDITGKCSSVSKNILKMCVSAPQMAGRYVGAGISGGVRLITHRNAVAFVDDGVYATADIADDKACVTVHADICDRNGVFTQSKKNLSLEAVILNSRGKRTARKVKSVKLKNTAVNTFEIPFKLSKFFMWSPSDPYLYKVKLTVKAGAEVLDEAESVLGIVSRALSPSRGLVLGGKSVKLKGAVMSADNGILGMESVAEAEEYKLSRIMQIGYNAVRYVGCPSEAALDTLDKLGLMAVVDIFDVWAQGNFPYDGHMGFEDRCLGDCERIVCQLRKHPSVVMYGLCNDAAEVYGRGEGSRTAAMLTSAVRSFDSSRPIVINSRERVPLREELEAAGLKSSRAEDATAAISMGREKNLFASLTRDSFACGDVAGYAYLYPRYSSDKAEYPDRLILGCAEHRARAFEAFDECDKNQNVIGEFVSTGADYLGYPEDKPVFEDESPRLLPPHASFSGDLDLIYNFKPSAYYRSITLGDRSKSCIVVADPESNQIIDKSGNTMREVHNIWNWPHSLGKTVNIEVYSGGEVVALYRDGKLIGRKLAGKANKHVATFRTEYYPGNLEAVGYHKGRECARVTLQSVTSPRAIKLECSRKSRKAGELLFVEIAITDKEGRVVPYASREVELTVTGQGELYALGSADREAQNKTGGVYTCPVYDGKALAVIKAGSEGDGKITVKATGDGLYSGKISLRVK